jgi:hypothetical protein
VREAKPRTERIADHIIPEYQDLKVGDVIADGPPGTAFVPNARLRISNP